MDTATLVVAHLGVNHTPLTADLRLEPVVAHRLRLRPAPLHARRVAVGLREREETVQTGVENQLDLTHRHRRRPAQLECRRQPRRRFAHPTMQARRSAVRRCAGVERRSLSGRDLREHIFPLVRRLGARDHVRPVHRTRLRRKHQRCLATRLLTRGRHHRRRSKVVRIGASHPDEIRVVAQETLLDRTQE